VNWRHWVLMVSLLTGCALGAHAAHARPAIDLNNDGVIALKSGDYPLALQKFKAALKLDPNYQMARDNMAITHNNYGLRVMMRSLNLLLQAVTNAAPFRPLRAGLLVSACALSFMIPSALADSPKITVAGVQIHDFKSHAVARRLQDQDGCRCFSISGE